MAFRLDSILNPSSPAPERADAPTQVASTYEAAATLTALSSGAPSQSSSYAYSNPPSAPQRPYHSPTNSYGGDARPGSSYGSHAIPVEPSPPLERGPPPLSSGLQQYHHGSKSPEEQRRESFTHQTDYATHLPPIEGLAQYEDGAPSVAQDSSTAHRHDTSQTATVSGNVDAEYSAQQRENNHVRDTYNDSYYQKPPSRGTSDLEHQQILDRQPSNTPQIKDESTMSPSTKPLQDPDRPKFDVATAKAIAAASNEHGTRGVRAKPSVEQQTPEVEPLPTKKKAPTAKVGTKKGVARKPTTQKKRRLEDDNDGRSMSPVAPASKSAGSLRAGSGPPGKNSKSNTPQIGSSPTPAPHETSVPPEDDDDEGEEMSDNELYCICRKPDNHSWMIACDGGCDDWFHGKCVNMKEEQGELIDKYICPNCAVAGKGVTTWKPGCRRDGCNRPARIRKDKQSKYCSEECGKEFMREKLGLDNERPNKKQKRKSTHTGAIDGADGEEEEDLGPRGGILRPGDVKAMLDASKNIDEFRALGDGVLSPPATASPERTTFDAGAATSNGDTATKQETETPLPQPPSYTLTPQESRRVQSISDEQDKLAARKVVLRDRERFVKMVVEQANRYAEKQGVKPKDVCGYDSRLAWSDKEFEQWSESKQGKDTMRRGSLDVTKTNGVEQEDTGKEGGGDGDVVMDDAPATTNGTGAGDTAEPRFCTKKRCEQHRQWQKNELTGVRADLIDLSGDAARLNKEEREMREQAFRRWKGEQGGSKKSGDGDHGHAEQRTEGWVEVV